MKNQTLTRSKYGQEPEIYLRVEYEQDNFHIGGLSKYLNIDEELSTEIAKVRATQDLTLDLGNLLQKLDEYSGRIDTIHFNISPRIKMSVNGNKHSLAELKDLLTDTFGQDTTHEISIWDERDNTLPN
jgi:CRISPR-associated protein Csh2